MPRWRAHAEKRREGTRALGAPTYRELYERFGFPLEELAAQARAFLEETEALEAITGSVRAAPAETQTRRVGKILSCLRAHSIQTART